MISGWPFQNIDDILFTRESLDGTLDSANKRSAFDMSSNNECFCYSLDAPSWVYQEEYQMHPWYYWILIQGGAFDGTYTRGLFDISPN